MKQCSPSGSSPRLRGTRSRNEFSRSHQRFIPASAGNATRPGGSSLPSAVHPRVCGERLTAARERIAQLGSSPRLRGTPAGVFSGSVQGRFIPASAGNAYVVVY